MNKLQIIIITGSIVLAAVALLIFSGIIPGFGFETQGQAGQISFWGTIPGATLAPVLSDFGQRFRNIKVDYREIDSKIYIDELVQALASGQGPDVFILPQDQILKQKDILHFLDSGAYSLRVFKDNFADLAELYVQPEGITALPIQIDPLVLYWNRDLFRNAGQALPPKTWDEFLSSAKTLTIKSGQKITQSGAAMGDFTNIKNAKDILALLMIQDGNKIVDPETLKPVFAERTAALSPAEVALLFFTSFSNPLKENYSWNRAQPEAIEAFGAGRLAMYLGFASDIEKISALNPHLNLAVGIVPQIKGGKLNATYGRSLALAISKQSQNKATALTFIYELTGLESQSLLAKNSFLAPSLRDLLAQKQERPEFGVFYESAIKSLGWLDPEPAETLAIWKEMAESVASGAKRINQATLDAQRKFETLMPKTN
ncbi:MAG: extracellular solute-binding protein [Patescibacteria group bacterium]